MGETPAEGPGAATAADTGAADAGVPPDAGPPQSFAVEAATPPPGRPTSTRSFSSAKREGWDIWSTHAVTIYCECDYTRPDPDRAGVPDLDSCGYEVPHTHRGRANRIEWEHVVPAARMGQGRQCWTRDDCTRPSTGSHLRGRECCEATDEEFAMMHADLYNLAPAVGQVNAIRSNHPHGIVPEEERLFGACDFEDDGDTAEPSPSTRGNVARAWLYMNLVYGMELSAAEQEMFEQWHADDPPEQWEYEWAERVREVQGNEHPLLGGSADP